MTAPDSLSLRVADENARARIVVLVAEDEPQAAELIDLALTEAGFGVLVASNGEEALRLLEEHDVDVVLLDVMMPLVNGYEVCKRIKTDRRFNSLPVIMLTALRQPLDRLEGIRTGADRYLTKPFNLDELVKAIEDELARAEERTARLAVREAVTFTFQSELKYLYEVNELVSQLYASTSFTDDDIINIRLSLDELGTNAIRHGNRNDASKRVTIRYVLYDDRLEIAIEDEGEGFDPESLPDPTRDDRLLIPSGRGVFLAQQLMDKVEYQGRGNRVVLTKYLPAPS